MSGAPRKKPATRLGREIRRLMAQHDMNQSEIAEALGVTRATVSALIRGKNGLTIPMAYWLGRVLATPAQTLFDRALADYVETQR